MKYIQSCHKVKKIRKIQQKEKDKSQKKGGFQKKSGTVSKFDINMACNESQIVECSKKTVVLTCIILRFETLNNFKTLIMLF